MDYNRQEIRRDTKVLPGSSSERASSAPGFKRLRKEQLRYILDNISDLICLHDLEGRIWGVNRSWSSHSGVTDPDWFEGKTIAQLIPGQYRNEVRNYLYTLSRKGSASGIASIQVEDGDERVLEYKTICISDDKDRPVAVARLGPDITERLRSEKALRSSEEKYRSILETIEDGYYEVDLEGRIIFCNPSLCRILGYTEKELLAKDYRDLCDQAYIDTIYRTFHSALHSRRPTKAFDWKLTRKDGSVCFVETSVSLIENHEERIVGFRGICRDITARREEEKERQSLEAQLFFSQKSEALGTLAAGFAHNFNNILFPLIGYIDMALMDIDAESPQYRHLHKALESANRAKEIIRRVQEYTRGDKDQQVQPIHITETVNQALRLVRGSLSRQIGIELDLCPECPTVVADPDQIQQVVVNLCTNANEAIAANGGGGRIDVSVSTKEITDSLQERAKNLSSGRYVRISICDTGCGIAPECSERIFDPFFTTKPETGKGLGLSLSHRIVKKYGGEICVESRPGEGTSVHVYLPQASPTQPPDARSQPSA
jgi:PAS domain S-box-containing protein